MTIRDVTAGGVRIRVVTVKKLGHCIIRGIYCFRTIEQVQAAVKPYVAIFDQTKLEWTTHQYVLPHYLAYGAGDLPRIGWPTQGIFRFRHLGGDVYDTVAVRLDPKPEDAAVGGLARLNTVLAHRPHDIIRPVVADEDRVVPAAELADMLGRLTDWDEEDT